MKDRLGNVADMLDQAVRLRDTAASKEEKHYFEREVYKWRNELMQNGVNPSDIDSYDFFITHRFNGFK
jgi:hypothetical protein